MRTRSSRHGARSDAGSRLPCTGRSGPSSAHASSSGSCQSSPMTSPPQAAASARYALTPREKLTTGTPAPGDSRVQIAVHRCDVAEVVLAPERPPGPGVEHLQRLCAGARLRQQIVRLHGRELRQQPSPRGGLGEHEGLRLREVLRRAALDRVARQREGRAGESDHRDVAHLELATDERDRAERPRHRLLRGRRAEQVDVPHARDGIPDPRPVALHEIEVEPHAD